jgi:hypothetical protein
LGHTDVHAVLSIAEQSVAALAHAKKAVFGGLDEVRMARGNP